MRRCSRVGGCSKPGSSLRGSWDWARRSPGGGGGTGAPAALCQQANLPPAEPCYMPPAPPLRIVADPKTQVTVFGEPMMCPRCRSPALRNREANLGGPHVHRSACPHSSSPAAPPAPPAAAPDNSALLEFIEDTGVPLAVLLKQKTQLDLVRGCLVLDNSRRRCRVAPGGVLLLRSGGCGLGLAPAPARAHAHACGPRACRLPPSLPTSSCPTTSSPGATPPSSGPLAARRRSWSTPC